MKFRNASPTRIDRKGRHPFVEVIWGVCHGLLIAAFGAGTAVTLVYLDDTPEASDILEYRFAQSSVLYDRTGTTTLYRLHGEENRRVISGSEIPDSVRFATIAAEDARFFEHDGIDFLAIGRAIVENVRHDAVVEGGSTITQQLARNLYLTRERTLRRKALEAIIAWKIERRLTKDEILTLYLNTIPYGSNAYGIEAAALTYFGRHASELSLDEATLLAAIPKATTYYSPYGARRDDLVVNQRRIIARMRDLGLVPADDARIALTVDTPRKLLPPTDPIIAPHFVFHVLDELEREYGRVRLETGGLRIVTTLDLRLQEVAERVVREGATSNASRGAENASLVAIDPRSGEILAMAGSRDFFDTDIDGQVNAADRARSPGSSFKPIIYGRALEEGFVPGTWLSDSPRDFGDDGSGGRYVPRNYDGRFRGPVTLREALQMSLNIPAIDILSRIGLSDAKEFARRMGITTISDTRPYGLSFAIGGLEVKLVDLVSAFSVYANDGVRTSEHSILTLSDVADDGSGGTVLGASSERVIESEIARKMNSILTDNVARTPIFGPRSPLMFQDRPVAAKTGTSQDFRDAWTVGYTPSLAAGVWVGNNDGTPMRNGADGVYVAAPLWRAFMDAALVGTPVEAFLPYEGEIEERARILADRKRIAEEKTREQERLSKENKKRKKK